MSGLEIRGFGVGNTVGGAAASFTNDLLTNTVGGGHVSGRKMLENAGKAAEVGFLFDIVHCGVKNFRPSYIKEGLRSIFKPFDFGRHAIDSRSVINIMDDFGRAAFGLNGGTSIVENYLDVYVTDRRINCGE